MNPLALVLVFSCGVSVGIVWGRSDERRKAATGAVDPLAVDPLAVDPRPPAPSPSPSPSPAAAPAAEPLPVAEAPPAPPAPPPADVPEALPFVEPAVQRALRDDVLAPAPMPAVEVTKKGKKAGFDPGTFVPSDDILDRMRRAEELGVDADDARDLLDGKPVQKPARPQPIDPALAERERRVLERLRAQQPDREDPDG